MHAMLQERHQWLRFGAAEMMDQNFAPAPEDDVQDLRLVLTDKNELTRGPKSKKQVPVMPNLVSSPLATRRRLLWKAV